MGNGNSGSVNLGIVGADWGPDGGGATFMGIRLGGSGGRGFEVGVNPGLGVQVNGGGLYAGARADFGIRDGVNVHADARGVALTEKAGAMAAAHAHGSGCGASSAAVTTAAVREATRVLEKKEEAVLQAQAAVTEASEELDSLDRQVAEKYKQVKAKEAAKKELQSQRDEKSIQITNLQKLRNESAPELQRKQLDVAAWSRSMARAMRRPEESSMALDLQTRVKTGQEAIAIMVHEIENLETEIKEQNAIMLQLQEEITEESRKLKDKQSQLDKARAEKQKWEAKLKTSKLEVKQAKADFERVRKERESAKKALRMVGAA